MKNIINKKLMNKNMKNKKQKQNNSIKHSYNFNNYLIIIINMIQINIKIQLMNIIKD